MMIATIIDAKLRLSKRDGSPFISLELDCDSEIKYLIVPVKLPYLIQELYKHCNVEIKQFGKSFEPNNIKLLIGCIIPIDLKPFSYTSGEYLISFLATSRMNKWQK